MGYLSREDAVELIEAGRFNSSPIQFSIKDVGGTIDSWMFDWILEAEWDGTRKEFVVEYERRSPPKKLQVAVQQVRELVSSTDQDLQPLVMVPHLDKNSLEYLEEQGVNGLDLCGNGTIQISGQWYVWKSGNPNQYPGNASIKNVFRGKSGLVPRLFLTEPRFKTVNAVV